MIDPGPADLPASRSPGSAARRRDNPPARPRTKFGGFGIATVGTLSAITAWLLAGLIAWETVVAFFGHAAVSLPTPAYWPAFLALGALGGVHDRKRRPFAAVSILALALLAATLPAADAFSVLTDGFVLAVAAMAGLGIGRTAALLIERRHSAPGFVPHGVTPPYRQRRHRPPQGSVR